jgi:hypothetical protein
VGVALRCGAMALRKVQSKISRLVVWRLKMSEYSKAIAYISSRNAIFNAINKERQRQDAKCGKSLPRMIQKNKPKS